LRARGESVPLHRLHQDSRCRGGIPRRGTRRRFNGRKQLMVDTVPEAPPRTGAAKHSGAPEFNIVGKSPAHHDFVQKVKGTLMYAADWKLPGMLYGKVVRSQIACGTITAIDTSAAEELPGVIAVLTAKDVPHNQIVENASGGLGKLTVTQPVLASDRVRYSGEPIAVIAATEPEIDHKSADLIEIDY